MLPPEIMVTIEQVGLHPDGGDQYLAGTARSSGAEICRNTFRFAQLQRHISHLGEVLKMLTPYPIPAQDADIDWTENAHKLVRAAIERFEEVPRAEKELLPEGISVTALVAQFYLMAGDYDKVVALQSEYDEGATPELADLFAWAYVMQSNALYDQAKTKAGEEADQLFAEAKEKLLSAESISPGSGAYNLACLSALHGEEAECLRWLEKSRELGKLPPREHLANDPDLDNVRESEWFKAFLVGV